jgi:hypothetical protein
MNCSGQLTLVTVCHELVKNVTLHVELWSDINQDPVVKTQQYSFDLAAAWLARPTLQLDAGIDLGLNSSTPKTQVFSASRGGSDGEGSGLAPPFRRQQW